MAKAKYLTRTETATTAKLNKPAKPDKTSVGKVSAAKTTAEANVKRPGVRKPASARSVRTFSFEPFDNERLANLNGPFDAHLRSVELKLGAVIRNRGNIYELSGTEALCRKTEGVLRELYDLTDERALGEEDLFLEIGRAHV